MTIGERIRKKRKDLNLTLKDLYNITNISAGNLSEIENGKYLPSITALLQLKNALNCSTDWLLTGVNNLESNYIHDETPIYSENKQLCKVEELLHMYNTLDERDKKEIYDIITLKYERNKR
ncbi:MAG: helix-turn-helix protein [Clostridiales bacterium]|nr:helix-turn-helix protein [Clostridiales bacterium]